MQQLPFWLLAITWLPSGIIIQAFIRFGPNYELDPAALHSLIPVSFCGLPLAIASRWLWRLDCHYLGVLAWSVLGFLTIITSVLAGLLGLIAIAVVSIILSIPVFGFGLTFSHITRKKSE